MATSSSLFAVVCVAMWTSSLGRRVVKASKGVISTSDTTAGLRWVVGDNTSRSCHQLCADADSECAFPDEPMSCANLKDKVDQCKTVPCEESGWDPDGQPTFNGGKCWTGLPNSKPSCTWAVSGNICACAPEPEFHWVVGDNHYRSCDQLCADAGGQCAFPDEPLEMSCANLKDKVDQCKNVPCEEWGWDPNGQPTFNGGKCWTGLQHAKASCTLRHSGNICACTPPKFRWIVGDGTWGTCDQLCADAGGHCAFPDEPLRMTCATLKDEVDQCKNVPCEESGEDPTGNPTFGGGKCWTGLPNSRASCTLDWPANICKCGF